MLNLPAFAITVVVATALTIGTTAQAFVVKRVQYGQLSSLNKLFSNIPYIVSGVVLSILELSALRIFHASHFVLNSVVDCVAMVITIAAIAAVCFAHCVATQAAAIYLASFSHAGVPPALEGRKKTNTVFKCYVVANSSIFVLLINAFAVLFAFAIVQVP